MTLIKEKNIINALFKFCLKKDFLSEEKFSYRFLQNQF